MNKNINCLPVWCLSLGCPKNKVDTEKLLGSLGLHIKIVNHISKSKLIYINTCAFIESATRESIRSILDSISCISKLKNKPLIVVSGCLPGRYDINELSKEIPEVDLWLSPKNNEEWPNIILDKLDINIKSINSRLITGKSYSYLKIGEGCNNKCSYCTIPSIKGKQVSYSEIDIINEAKKILDNDIKEIILVSQDTSTWSNFLHNNKIGIIKLINNLCHLDKLKWLRILYLNPMNIDHDFIKELSYLNRPFLPYFDIPFQHINANILNKMGRKNKLDFYNIIDTIRNNIPNAVFRTNLIVGFPGEDDNKFNELIKFVQDIEFDHLGVFPYYNEEGTKSSLLSNFISQKIKEDRKTTIMEIQSEISKNKLKNYNNRFIECIIDESMDKEWPGLYKGRTWFQAPEIDGCTFISGEGIKLGDIREIYIENSNTYDLTGLA